ncbi:MULTISPECIES: molybdate ABC transporter substrate-binding protein [unclassified Brachybacterium]|uniref:molybdate ABC transporter substrate-binding protein n=1 Tax=unclassified Brachybacterium TaxID=2623841 RepID=UPI000C7F7B51|nr:MULTISPECIES: molybdate ABC transporter substrate-binding protein [unclassified Brachybacterium]PMC75450.1 molybdate ABC transporter substrate-binding protein [Brachybacterium sp. UMB0905]
MSTHFARRLLALLGALLLLAGCARGAGPSESSPVTLQVFAAASLQLPFEELGQLFEAQQEGVSVSFTFAGSSTLVEQIQHGAPADVFAAADERTMHKLTDQDLHGAEPIAFATNTLMIAVPPGNPADITDLASLAQLGVNLVVCAPEVPCGAATQQVEQAAGLSFSPVSEEQSVTDVLGKVTSGEADAGLVYATDVRKAGDAVEGITFPQAEDAVNIYPITTVKDSADPALAQEFVDLVTSEDGQRALAEHGFAGP